MGKSSQYSIIVYWMYFHCSSNYIITYQSLKVRKNGQQKTYNLLCNSWIAANSGVARIITHVQTCCQPHLLQYRFDMSGETCNITIRLVLQQCSKASCTSLWLVFPYFNMLISPPISSNSLIFGKVLLSLLSQPRPHLPFFLGKSPEDEVAKSLSSLGASSPKANSH